MGKKYCIFSAQFLPHLGGVERYTYNLAEKLIERGHEVTVVTSQTGGLKEYEELDGIEVFRIPCWNFINGRYPVLKPSKTLKEITNTLKEKKFDLVIVNCFFYIHSLYAQNFAKKNAIKCITINHGTSHLSVHNKVFDCIGGVYEHMITKIGQRFCENYYGVSDACNEWLEHFNIKAKGTLYNAVDLEDIERLKSIPTRNFREENKIPENAIVVTFTGRLLKEKGLYEMIAAVEMVNKLEQKIYLMIAGDGDEEEFVKAHSSEYIRPLGRLSFPDVITLLVQSDIFCLPSFSEGFSTSALEAAACECFIITTKRGGTKELVCESDYGIVMEDNGVALIYAALIKCIKDKPLRDRAVKLCYARVKDKFTWDSTADEIEKIL